jgi:hypothetical protein
VRFIITILFLFLASCGTSLTGTKSGDNTPAIPGGAIGTGQTLTALSGLEIDNDTPGQIKLSYKIPALYKNINGIVNVYRKNCDPSGYAKESCVMVSPSPTVDPNIGFYLGSSTGTSYLDITPSPGSTYTYWLVVKSDNGWSDFIKATIEAKKNEVSVSFSTLNFWENINTTFGYDALSGVVNKSVIGSSVGVSGTSFSRKNGISVHKSGLYMAIADTANNRVLIYGNPGATSCDSSADSNEYQMCLAVWYASLYTPMQVIGQPDFSSTKNCQTHIADGTTYTPTSEAFGYKYCLTSPSDVEFENDNLIISDTGNNRVLIKAITNPNNLCEKNVVFGRENPTSCSFDKTIGNYSGGIYASGLNRYSLDNPQGLETSDGDLYIADTNNNRVLLVKDYVDKSGCNMTSWDQNSCVFDGVLGQKDYVTKEYFGELVSSCNESDLDDVFIRSSGTGRVIDSSKSGTNSGNYLKRHFRSPSSVYIDSDGGLYVAGNEGIGEAPAPVCSDNEGNEMKLLGRILYWQKSPLYGDNPNCSDASSFRSGRCDADKVIGQPNFSEVLGVSVGQNYNESKQYAITSISGMTVFSGNLMALDMSNNRVILWNSWKTITGSGIPRSSEASDPSGAQHPSRSTELLPNLLSLSDIDQDPVNNALFLSDSGIGRLFKVTSGN